MARNWDDILQRDLKAQTFPRALAIFTLHSMALFTVFKWARLLLPVGRFGITSVTQTPLYNKFGYIGVGGTVALGFFVAHSWYKTLRFTTHKFYTHVLCNRRNYLL